jgi:monoamine oxidase
MKNTKQSALTRRNFLSRLGAVGGSAAVYQTMSAMGLLYTSDARAAGFRAQWEGQGRKEHPHRPRIVILGAGVAGLTIANELQDAGYDYVVLEARDRAGGRSHTIRGGDLLEEFGIEQRCEFDRDPELFFNSGPARIPHHHRHLLDICHRLNVRLETHINENRAAFFHDAAHFGGKAVRNREVMACMRGNVAELLAKAVSSHALDDVLSEADALALLRLCQGFGDLNSARVYTGSTRAGLVEGTGELTPSQAIAPLDFSEFLQSDFNGFKLNFGEGYDQAATMLAPVGGMDAIAKALYDRVKHNVKLGRVVRALRRQGEGARIEYDRGSHQEAIEADLVIVTIPASVLRNIDNDFSTPAREAIAAVTYSAAGKIAFQSDRFWEREHGIYGGISWSTNEHLQSWYPDNSFGHAQGIYVASYLFGGSVGQRFASMQPNQRIEWALASNEAIHPEARAHFRHGVSRSWLNTPYSQGGWATSAPSPALAEPDGPFIYSGEHVTYLAGWQEGAVISAYAALAQVADYTARTAD